MSEGGCVQAATTNDNDNRSYTSDYESSSPSSTAPTIIPERDEVEEILKLSYEDTRRIRIWRFTLVGLLISTGLTVTVIAYTFLRHEEFKNFEHAYAIFARTIASAAISQQQNVRSIMQALSTYVSSSALIAGAEWPFHTVPYFEKYAAIQRTNAKSAGIEFFSVCPLVSRENRAKYENFTAANHEAMVLDSYTGSVLNYTTFNPTRFSPSIFGVGPQTNYNKDDTRDYMLPIWQWSPPPYTYGQINWDVVSVPAFDSSTSAAMILKNQTVVSMIRPYANAIGNSISEEDHHAMHSALPNSKVEHPHSVFIHPIRQDPHDDESDVVGVIGGGVAWDAALQDLLPNGVFGIVAVIRNNCNQTFTYIIDGEDAFYLGEGDEHDAQYDPYEVVVDLALHTHDHFETTPGHCMFQMHVYPTRRFFEHYQSKTPEVFALVVSLSFVFVVSVVFFVYDLLVQSRNYKLIANAARTNAIIASMFPESVRNEVLGHHHATGNDESILADLYPETTVLFADIVGFTGWCSSRDTSEVFVLLEAVYEAFDIVADRRRVFKVETIGDCYVAVTGLPNPQPNHSTIMARFANDCIFEFARVTKCLASTLGPETSNLGIRVGINSGPVTAGVLRGTKARFQLFGDTVNTAARMESNGMKNRIHVSQSTADELVTQGKHAWLSVRDEKIVAKGLGEIQTYWVQVNCSNRRGSYGTSNGEDETTNDDENESEHDDECVV